MKNKLAITILERDNYESPNIGTIVGATEEELVAKATTAIESHFDGIVTNIRIKNGLKFSDLKNSPPIDIYATIDGTYEVVMDAQETWIF